MVSRVPYITEWRLVFVFYLSSIVILEATFNSYCKDCYHF